MARRSTSSLAGVANRPPSVDALARSLTRTGLPQPLLIDAARAAIAAGDPALALAEANAMARALLQPVINATGVLLHTNLGRAPVAHDQRAGYTNLELDLATGGRGSRSAHTARLLARLCGAPAALVVNNNAAAVLLVVAALATGRQVVVSRGEAVEIGGGFRIPEVMEQSGARLIDVGTTNRTRLSDYRRAIERRTADVALVLKVHPSNYRVEGFTSQVTVEQLAGLGIPVVADIGSGLVDAACPWLSGPPPAWLADEPAARQTLEAGAALVTFSADKLFGGPQAGVIAGQADLVAACAAHPLARALRPGGLVLDALQDTALAYLRRDTAAVPFWQMVSTPTAELEARAAAIVVATSSATIGGAPIAPAEMPRVEAMEALPGAGSLPGVTLASAGVAVAGDHVAAVRERSPAIIARVRDDTTYFDLRTVAANDDALIVDALTSIISSRRPIEL
jgi:L-seryl-tRNA(Ser) seleniumtransferase